MLPAQSVSAERAAELGVSSGLPWPHCAERISPEAHEGRAITAAARHNAAGAQDMLGL